MHVVPTSTQTRDAEELRHRAMIICHTRAATAAMSRLDFDWLKNTYRSLPLSLLLSVSCGRWWARRETRNLEPARDFTREGLQWSDLRFGVPPSLVSLQRGPLFSLMHLALRATSPVHNSHFVQR